MTFKNLLLIGFAEDDFTKPQWGELNALADSVHLVPKDGAGLAAATANADAIGLRLGTSFDAKNMDAAPNLQYLGMFGTGYGRIDTSAAAERGIVVCNVADYATDAVAEFAIAAILGHVRETERALSQARTGDYSEGTFQGSELNGKTLGVIGLGCIGRRIAQIAQNGFRAKVCYWSRRQRDEAFEFQELDALLQNADIISLNLALTPETASIIDASRSQLLRPQSLFLNLAPMDLIDLPGIETRLRKNDISFVFDHSDEMAPDDVRRLQQYRRCQAYPPIAYTTIEASARKQRIFIDNIKHALAGTPTNRVN